MPNVKLLTVLNRLGQSMSAELDIERVVNMIVENGVDLTDARYGAFFYHTTDEIGHTLELVTVVGAEKEQFGNIGRLSVTPLLSAHVEPGVLRVNDVLADSRYGHNAHKGIPPNHLPIRSYLACAVQSRTGERLGSLLFGHPEPNMFNAEHEATIVGLSAMGAVAMDNANLYLAAQREIEERKEAQEQLINALDRQKLLLDELNHRVKNTLATIQSIAIQTRNSISVRFDGPTIDQFYEAFESRLLSLSRAHDLLVLGAWIGVGLNEAIIAALTPHVVDTCQVIASGCPITLSPNAVVTMNMVFHELATNACKYGALTVPEGRINISWTADNGVIVIEWKETGGPIVSTPMSSGFGTRLIERGAMRELGGLAKLHYDADGVKCVMTIPVSNKVSIGNAI